MQFLVKQDYLYKDPSRPDKTSRLCKTLAFSGLHWTFTFYHINYIIFTICCFTKVFILSTTIES